MPGAIKKAVQLFRVLSRKSWTYAEIEEKYGVTRRTATRWIMAARKEFGDNLTTEFRRDGRKAFQLRARTNWFMRLNEPNPGELAALDIALDLLENESMVSERESLESLRDHIRNLLEDRDQLLRLDTDVEALFESVRVTFRPGPRTAVNREVRGLVRRAILELKKVAFTYEPWQRAPSRKKVGPYGLLFGGTERLVAVPDGGTSPLQYRLDRMSEVQVLDEAFVPPEGRFREYCRDLFRSYGEPPFDVEWRFHRKAPGIDRWEFHPDQRREVAPDGSVVVRFRAGGVEDMARHLIGWWDWIEGIRPKKLREMVLRMRLAGLAPLIEEFADRETADRIRELAAALGAGKLDPGREGTPD